MKHIEIYYEELSADPVKVITQCLDFLQCSHLKPEQYVTNLVKVKDRFFSYSISVLSILSLTLLFYKKRREELPISEMKSRTSTK